MKRKSGSALYKLLFLNGKVVYEHRHIVEQALGRKLLTTELVHHINDNPRDNRLENLTVLTKSEHQRLHILPRWDLERAAALRRDGMSYRAIARQIGAHSHSNISRILRKRGF